jgi:hypothetical protein
VVTIYHSSHTLIIREEEIGQQGGNGMNILLFFRFIEDDVVWGNCHG